MKINDLVTIDGYTYIVFSNCKFSNTTYYYLTNGKQKIYCLFNNKKIVIVEDNILINKLTPLFIENFKLHFDII
ncbi:unknown [Firmicutes bacterium CAG:582]|nr:unknown [Firmicutes bacterium CAG:582]